MLKTKWLALIALFALLGMSPAKAATYTYSVDFTLVNQNGAINIAGTSTTTVTGDIVTNCTYCFVQPSNIVSWNFNLGTFTNVGLPGAGPIIISSSADSSVHVQYLGSPLYAEGPLSGGSIFLTADPGQKATITFSSFGSFANIEFSSNTVPLIDDFFLGDVPNATPIVFGQSDYPVDGARPGGQYAVSIASLDQFTCGIHCLLNPVNLGPNGFDHHDLIHHHHLETTPLPAALPLFASGLGALGLLGWRRKRKASAIAAA